MPDRVSTSHDVGGIQPIGSLIGCGKADQKVRLVSENISDFVPALQVEDVLGKSAEHVLGGEVLHSIRNAQTLPSIHNTPELLGTITIADTKLDASVFEAGDLIVLELMAVHPPVSALALIRDISRLSDRMKDANGIDMLFSRILSLIRILSGYDRVQVLQHQHAGTYVVIAESRRGPVRETLGQELANPTQQQSDVHPPYQVIHDIGDAVVTLRSDMAGPFELPLLSIPHPTSAKLAQLIEQDMQAELTVPLRLEGGIWGVLQFQHRRPRLPSPQFRYVCRAILPLLEAWIARWDGVTHNT